MSGPTKTERDEIRQRLYYNGIHIEIWEENDQESIWAADVAGILMEAKSAPELLRDIANMLEES